MASVSFAQSNAEPDSKTNTKRNWGAYGGTLLQLSNPGDETSLFVGGQGAIVLNSKFVLGAFGLGSPGSAKLSGSSYGYDQDLELSMGYGGIYLEYIIGRHKLFHPSVSLPVGIGRASVKQDGSDDKISKTSLLTFSPRLNLEFNLGNNALIAIFGGYQLLSAENQFLVSSNDLSSWQYGVCLKLGQF